MRPETRYAKTGDVHIAYQVVGEGAMDLVLVQGWISHIEHQWEDPSLARFLERLASFSRLITFDERGTGLSNRVAESALPTLEHRMDDVRAVMEAAGCSRAALFGISEGGPMCALFAATYPARTSALVMYGTYAKWIRDAEYPWAPTRADHGTAFEAYEKGWGTPTGLKIFARPRRAVASMVGSAPTPGRESWRGSGALPDEHRDRRSAHPPGDQGSYPHPSSNRGPSHGCRWCPVHRRPDSRRQIRRTTG
jgi:pimeloyl-ACP methyl ester carboxylesterase